MSFERRPELDTLMDDAEQVQAFHEAGEPGGPLFSVYHFNALALSSLCAPASMVLDVGVGPAKFLSHLLTGRPDLTGIGLDPSPRMLALASKVAENSAVGERLSLREGDFASVDRVVGEKVGALVCLSALHHCRDFGELVSAVAAFKRLREAHGCAIWLFRCGTSEQ